MIARSRFVPLGDVDGKAALIVEQIDRGRRDPRVRALALRILRDTYVPAKDHRAEVIAIHDWLRTNTTWRRDPKGLDTFADPITTMEGFGGQGDCDDLSVLEGALLESAGIPSRVAVIRLHGGREFSHVYTEAGLPPSKPAEWIPLDLTMAQFPAGWEAPAALVSEKRTYPGPGLQPRFNRGLSMPRPATLLAAAAVLWLFYRRGRRTA